MIVKWTMDLRPSQMECPPGFEDAATEPDLIVKCEGTLIGTSRGVTGDWHLLVMDSAGRLHNVDAKDCTLEGQ